MINIQSKRVKIDKYMRDWIKHSAQTALNYEKVDPSATLTILISDDDYLRTLNREFRQIDHSTDVLSFPSDVQLIESDEQYLGDIAISYPTAVEQSIVAGHPINFEIALLSVHGVLHLLGYDHECPEHKNEMWQHQESILKELGVKIIKLSGDTDE